MKKILVLLVITAGVFFGGCKEVSDSEKFYIEGIKAEQNMNYQDAIGLFAKSLQYNREDAVTWYAKGRCHLLLTMQTALMDSISSQQSVKIMGNLQKASDCFKRAEQWGFSPSHQVDSLQVWVRDRLE